MSTLGTEAVPYRSANGAETANSPPIAARREAP